MAYNEDIYCATFLKDCLSSKTFRPHMRAVLNWVLVNSIHLELRMCSICNINSNAMNIFGNYDAHDCSWEGCEQEWQFTRRVKWGAFLFLRPWCCSDGHYLICCVDTVIVYSFTQVIECYHYYMWLRYCCTERFIYMSSLILTFLHLSVTGIYTLISNFHPVEIDIL